MSKFLSFERIEKKYKQIERNRFPSSSGEAIKRAQRIAEITRLALPDARKRLNILEQINGIDPGARAELRRNVVHLAAQVAVYALRRKMLLFSFYNILFALLFLNMTGVPTAIYFLSALSGFWAYAGFMIGSFLVFWFLYIFLILPAFVVENSAIKTFRAPHPVDYLLKLWILSGLFAFALILLLLIDYYDIATMPWYLLLMVSALALIQVVFLTLIISYFIITVIEWFHSALLRRNIPDLLFADCLLDIIDKLGVGDKAWFELRTKKEIMLKIEEAARIAEKDIPFVLHAADPYADVWLQEKFKGIATALRVKKYWIGMPKPDSRQHFLKSLTITFINAVNGSWDFVEKEEPSSLGKLEIKKRIRVFVLGITTAVAPAIIYKGAQEWGFLTQGLVSDYLGIGVVIWALMVFLYTIDPRLGEKLDIFNKFMQFYKSNRI